MNAAPRAAPTAGDFDAFVETLRERRADLPRRLAQGAEHVMAHLDEMAFGSTAEIAAAIGVQASTLVRFAQALGYSGFSELQDIFKSRLRRRSVDHRDRLKTLRASGRGRGEASTLLEGFAQASEASLAQMRKSVPPADLQAAVAMLAKARTIVLVGARRSFPVVSYLSYAFGGLGVPAVLIDQIGGLGPEQAIVATPTDALLAVSYAPYAQTTLDIAAAAHRRGVPVLGLTDSALSPLVENCRLWIEIAEADFGAFRTNAATFAVAMTLAIATAERRRAPTRSPSPSPGAR